MYAYVRYADPYIYMLYIFITKFSSLSSLLSSRQNVTFCWDFSNKNLARDFTYLSIPQVFFFNGAVGVLNVCTLVGVPVCK